jgi:DNA-binding GntR family transcriptional regulator
MSELKGRNNMGETIRETLESDILSGRLPAGSQIEERALMERFNVSRTPARQAMLQLVQGGFVKAVPRQGVVVIGISLPDYIAMLEVLVELEGAAARLAARRMSSEQRDDLQRAARQCEESASLGNAGAYSDANRLFHELIYAGSCNHILAKQVRAMRARMQHPNDQIFSKAGRMHISTADHTQILEAILGGNEDAAYVAMVSHITGGGNIYADSVAMKAGAADDQRLAQLREAANRSAGLARQAKTEAGPEASHPSTREK